MFKIIIAILGYEVNKKIRWNTYDHTHIHQYRKLNKYRYISEQFEQLTVKTNSTDGSVYNGNRKYVKTARKFKRKVRQIEKIDTFKTKIDKYICIFKLIQFKEYFTPGKKVCKMIFDEK